MKNTIETILMGTLMAAAFISIMALASCSSQYETAKKVTVVQYRVPVQKVDSIKGALKFRSPIKFNTVRKCN